MKESTGKELAHSLHEVIEAWLEERAEAETLPNAWWPEHLTEQMTDAAMAVFLASVDSSQFTEEQERG